MVFDRYQGLCFCRGVLCTTTLLYDRILSTGDPIDRQPSPSPINFIRFVGGCPSIGAPVDRVRSCFEGVRCEIPAALPCFALDTMRVAKRFPSLRLRRPRICLTVRRYLWVPRPPFRPDFLCFRGSGLSFSSFFLSGFVYFCFSPSPPHPSVPLPCPHPWGHGPQDLGDLSAREARTMI